MKLMIIEVDCYKGNEWAIGIYRTSNYEGVQHQIILKDGDTEHCIGPRNGVADSGRGERVCFEAKIDDSALKYMKAAKFLYRKLNNSDVPESEIKSYNDLILDNIKLNCKKIWERQSLSIEFDRFYKHINVFH